MSTYPLKVVNPTAITDAVLVSSNVAEDSSPAWTIAGVYALDDVVHLAATHRRYRSILGAVATVTVSIASPGMVMWAAHGQAEGTPVVFTTTGALPTGLVAGTVYFVRNPGADTFQLSAAAGGAVIATSGTQSGIHTLRANAQRGRNPATDGKAWQDIGSTNRWAMFGKAGSKTTNAGPINLRLRPGGVISGLGLLGLAGASVRVRMVDPDAGTVYDSGVAPLGSLPLQVGWWYFYYGRRAAITQSLHLDLPPYPGADLLIDIEGSATACATCLIGQQQEFGMGVQLGAKLGINDFSRKEFDPEFGDLELVERGFSDRASFEMWLERPEVDATRRLLASLRARPCLWIGSSLYESTTVYGIYRSFSIDIAYRDLSKCSLDLEGLTTND
ncbi:hypothetical protein [Xylophilus ampelinus]|uniref:Uncharacterized protein n=1 Tax=Xylophilus ampelinus TaxID=54067 RepID=A0A318SKJ1_9BURK|nr:hypothetical protein [Xylophilus ampelinus]MCS4508886.1 hypothetical protein [Xylophilus ampelinus]PYE79455.1 hypothetical protein DFQ15_102188 [Xylophilus ampelinus]